MLGNINHASMLSYEPVLLADRWDADFRSIIAGSWANESNGDVESPVGHFSIITISDRELPELREANDLEPLTMQKLPDGSIGYNGFGWIGTFIVQESSQGFTYVYAIANDLDGQRVFTSMCAEYDDWWQSAESDTE